MEIISPISRLVMVLEQVKLASQQHKAKLMKNEAITRAVLIDPVLRALGWDTTNPNMIEFEPFYKGTKLDYALNDQNGNVKIIVEAKALGENLSDDKIFTMVLAYGLTYNFPSVFLTNGIIWKHYKLAEINNIKDPVILDLGQGAMVEAALYLIQHLDALHYWTEHQSPIPLKVTKQVEVPQTITPPAKQKPIVKETVLTSAVASEQGEWVSLFSLATKDLKGMKSPTAIRLPDGSVKQITYWRDILYESVLFVLASTPNLSLPILDKAGKKCLLIDYQKLNQKGSISTGSYQGKQVFIYLNYDTNNMVKNALYILNCLPSEVIKNPSAVIF